MSDHWKALADRLGAPGLDPSARRVRETAPSSAPATAKPAVPHTPDSSRSSSPPQEVAEQQTQSLDTPLASEATNSTPDTSKKKKKSNWERVANLFGIATPPQVEETTPLEETTPSTDSGSSTDSITSPRSISDTQSAAIVPPSRSTPEPAPPAGRKAASRSGFNVAGLFESTTEEVNPALTEMFGHSQPNYGDSWEKNKRLVDDVGWEETTDVWEESLDHDTPAVQDSAQEETIDPIRSDDGNEESEFPRRRSRRRRRRGRRSDQETGSDSARSDLDSSIDRSSHEASDAESFSEGDSLEVGDEVPESKLPERRSSRRRPRHRREGFNQPTADETRKDSDEIPLEDTLEVAEDSSFGSARTRTESTAERDEDGGHSGRRRRRRSRGGSDRAERDERPERSDRNDRLPEDQLDTSPLSEADEVDDEDDLDLAERSSHRSSRNIPTWDDTLAVMIASNLENHRRNESRGSRGGGRPRGRR